MNRVAEPPVEVSVLVAVRNEARFIRETMAAILDQRFDGPIEYLAIDGCSDDGTREILVELAAEDPRIRVLDNPKRHLAGGLNIGLREARGEFIAQMEGHSNYPSHYLAMGIERLRRGDVEWVSGRPIPVGVDAWSRRVALALTSWLGTGGARKWMLAGGEVQEAELDTGVFGGFWRRRTLLELGGWDEAWPVNRDSELAARILAAGGRIVALRDLTASYIPRSDLRALGRQYWRYGFYRAKTAVQYPGSMRRSHALLPGLAVCVLGAAMPAGPLRRPARAGLALYAGALGVAVLRIPAGIRDRLALPLVFGTMHLSWGFGFLAGCARFGVPLRAFAALLTR